MNKIVWCRQGWYPIPYGFCPSVAAWRREMKRLGCDTSYPDSDARTTSFEKADALRILVTLHERNDNRDPVGVVGLLVHEAVHVWQGMQDHIGESQSSKEEEAYAIQLISQELMVAYSQTRMPR